MPRRESIEWEPQENCYVLNIVLSDITKARALEISEAVQGMITEDYGDEIGEVLLTTAHVKSSRFSPRSNSGQDRQQG